jgi:hypothetical protein
MKESLEQLRALSGADQATLANRTTKRPRERSMTSSHGAADARNQHRCAARQAHSGAGSERDARKPAVDCANTANPVCSRFG